MDIPTLEQIIKQYVQLQPPNHKGWQAVRCHVCNDHTRKGLRGAFLFDNDKVVYKCWNCDHMSTYDPYVHEYPTNSMITTLDAFGIPKEEWQQVILDSPAYKNGGKKQSHSTKELNDIEPKEAKLPDIFYLLKNAKPDDFVAEAAREYLIDERGIDPDGYPFMLSHKSTTNPRQNKWIGRIIIPIYKNNKLIFYTGRALYEAKLKYETPAIPKEKVLYGFDRLFEHTPSPLIVTEGWFDGYAVDGVATFGKIITPYQAEWLNRSKREKIYVPDKFGDGKRAAEQALEFGWNISTPDIGSSCKDVADGVKRYGKLYVLRSIMKHKATGFTAAMQLANYCE